MQTTKTTTTAIVLVALAALVAAASAERVHLGRKPHRLVRHERVGRTIRAPAEVFQRGRALVAAAGPRGLMADLVMTEEDSGTAGLYGGIVQFGEFYVNLTIGGQEFRTQLDTGSSTLAVPAAGCTVPQTGKSCTFVDPPFKPTPNTQTLECGSEACAFQVRYLDQSGMEGVFLSDNIVLGGLNASSAPFGGMNSTSPDFESSTDGILGAAYQNINCFPQAGAGGGQKCFPTVLDSLVQDGMRNVFGICLDSAHGRWDLGELDQQYAESDYQWAPIDSSNGFYEVPLQGFAVGNTTVPSYQRGQTVIVDSGTTLVVMPKDAFAAVTAALQQQAPPQAGPLLAGKTARLSQDELNQWPVFEYTLPGNAGGADVVVSLGPQAYMVGFGGGEYAFGIAGMETGGQHILGDVFMQQFYVGFDRAASRVGFVPVRDCQRVY